MEIKIAVAQDSDNTDTFGSIPPLTLSESNHGRLRLKLEGPDREVFVDRHQLQRALDALFPKDPA